MSLLAYVVAPGAFQWDALLMAIFVILDCGSCGACCMGLATEVAPGLGCAWAVLQGGGRRRDAGCFGAAGAPRHG